MNIQRRLIHKERTLELKLKNSTIKLCDSCIYRYIGVLSVAVIIIGSGIGDLNPNPGEDYLHITLC